ncbi:MAG: hypothetical protein H7Y17_09885, partial [Chlorobia bacterium]|nr:hypothetical protein [Fimbriimonadaceae bacterium]
ERPGPEHRVQFVIELVGPRSCPAVTAASLLDQQWHDALGKPQVFAMSPADKDWQELTPRTDGSYDSIALAWDLAPDQGELTSQAAAHLFQVAESFGTHIQRRAMPLPPPADVNRYVAILRELKDSLDIGVEILMVPRAANFPERDVWIALAELGYDLKPSGFFEIWAQGSTDPLVTVTPTGGQDAFALSSVERGVTHPGLLIGFSLPLSQNPTYSLDAAYRTADHLCAKLNAAAFTDADQMLGHSARNELSSNLMAAVRTMVGAGIEPGSRAAKRLFS